MWGVMYVNEGGRGFFTDCTFHHNEGHGINAAAGGLIELRGGQTEVHHSGYSGVAADHNAIINIYIPSRSITALVHDNRARDLSTYDGGKIQSQLSSSSLELTVIHEATPDGDSGVDFMYPHY